jgi:uncharacterized protein with NAD-binding domain and iron-sulfur cluster
MGPKLRDPGGEARGDMSRNEPIEVAVIGGGCASITTAFELTRPEHEGRYRVTVYQEGWRLGGKGRSGRGPADRIEEHGLHLWMGFYENAFGLMRQCYAELGRDPQQCRIADWRDAFSPLPLCGVTDRSPSGRWLPWMALFPAREGMPGDSLDDPSRWTVADYMMRSVSLLRTVLQAIQQRGDASGERARPRAGWEGWAEATAAPPAESARARIAQLSRYGELTTLTALIEAVGLLETLFQAFPLFPRDLGLPFLESISNAARRQLEGLIENDDELRRLWELIDLILAIMRGSIRFGLLTDPRGFDAIDDYDCREWLRLNGASERSTDSAFLRALYDLAFAYENGDVARPRIAAGQALRGAVRAFFTYRGSFFWKMHAGMGDVVFAPFYEVLKRRGVRFEFFHRLSNVKLVDSARLAPGERPWVEALEFDVQAHVAGGAEYRPLVDVRGLPCWPAEPDWSQLDDGERLKLEDYDFESHWDRRKAATRTLHVRDDFDLVVLGVGIGAIPHVCQELIARDPRWRVMVERVQSVATQAFQIWTSADMKELGWEDGQTALSGFVEPFDTWADMRHLISEESFAVEPRALAYFCSVLPDSPPTGRAPADHTAAARREEVRHNAVRFLNRDIVGLWPRAHRGPGEFRWELLVDPADPKPPAKPEEADEARFASQFWTANVSPTDRYALALPGSLAHRISPLDPSYDNFTICGDWTACGFTEGCVEAAVMSGRLAAHAISLSPPLERIVGFDHP